MIDINSLDKFIESKENEVTNIRPDTEKKIIWSSKNNQKTKTSLVFIHGFSATRFELSPVIEMLGKELQANVFFTRLKGHGQDGKALGEATFDDWMIDIQEAIEIGNSIGDYLVLIGCSTGCSLIHTILEQSIDIKAVIYVSPNFGPKSLKGQLLRVPGAKFFMPLVFGNEHFFISKNQEHERCWTTADRGYRGHWRGSVLRLGKRSGLALGWNVRFRYHERALICTMAVAYCWRWVAMGCSCWW